MELGRFGEHDTNSHKANSSKHLKHNQIVAVADVILIALQQSAAQLRRNIPMADSNSPGKHIEPVLLRFMQRCLKAARARLTVKQLEGCTIDDSFGSLNQFAANCRGQVVPRSH
jgi:hypothetical protein